jgi:hypothetical protein
MLLHDNEINVITSFALLWHLFPEVLARFAQETQKTAGDGDVL